VKVLKLFGYALAAAVGLFVVMLIIVAMTPEDKRRQYSHEAMVDRECSRMLSDSALGAERRMTRDICEGMKAENKKRYGN